MSKKSFKEQWDDLSSAGKEAAKDTFAEGKSIEESLSSGRSMDTIIKIFLVPAFIIFVIGLIISVYNFFHNNCLHKDFNPKKYQFDYEHDNFEVWCRECDRYIPRYTYSTEEIIKEPTCLEPGTKIVTYTCKEFSQLQITIEEEINKIPCNKEIILQNKVEPTCISIGYTAKTQCSYCQQIFEREQIDKIDHSYVEVGYVAPTCTTVGYTPTIECSWCHLVKEESKEIEITPHNLTGSYTTEPTYENGGYEIKTCEDCSYEEISKITSPALASTIFEYYTTDKENNEVILTNLISTSTEIVIPGCIDGIPVKKIPSNIFKNNSTLEKVTISEGIEFIDKQAFANCTSLKEINFPNSYITIEEEAFLNCSSLRKIKINYGRTKEKSFAECSNLRIVEFGKEFEGIGNNSFYNCLKIVFFKFPAYYGSNRVNVFDTEMRYTNNINDTSNYVTLTSGSHSLIDNYSNGKTSDDVIKITDGFYYYRKNGNTTLISIDRDDKDIVLPTNKTHGGNIHIIDGRTFRDMEDQLDSIFVPMSVHTMSALTTFNKNLKIYYEGVNILKDQGRDIGSTYINPETSETIVYKSIPYLYSETNKNDGKLYWYYDNEGNICEHSSY